MPPNRRKPGPMGVGSSSRNDLGALRRFSLFWAGGPARRGPLSLPDGSPLQSGVGWKPTRVKPAASASDIEASKRNDVFWLDDEKMDVDAVKKLKEVLADLRAKGIPVLVCEGFRSAQRQRLLFCRNRTKEELLQAGYTAQEIDEARRKGHTEKAPVAANTWKWSPESGHGGGTAIDVRWLWKGEVKPSLPYETWEKPMRRTIVDVHGCKWGGDWVLKGGKRDYGHIEYVKREKPQ